MCGSRPGLLLSGVGSGDFGDNSESRGSGRSLTRVEPVDNSGIARGSVAGAVSRHSCRAKTPPGAVRGALTGGVTGV